MTSRVSRLRTIVASIGLVAAVSVAACATGVDGQDADEAQTQAEQTAEATETKRHWRGPAGVVVDAARQHADLTEAQETTLAAIDDELHAERVKGETREKLRASAVAIVRSGSADSEQFDQAIDQALNALLKRIDANHDAMKEIHAILDTEQREAVADALHERIEERWTKRSHKRASTGRIAAHLMLSTMQLDKLKMLHEQIRGDKKQVHPTREELVGLVDAFKGDKFAEALDTFHEGKVEIMRDKLSRAGDHTDTVLTLLTADQRELLADLIDRGPKTVLFGEDAAANSGAREQ